MHVRGFICLCSGCSLRHEFCMEAVSTEGPSKLSKKAKSSPLRKG